MAAKKDLYKILGVKKSASADEVRKAYRKKAKECHPDMKNGNPERFALVKKSYDILSDEERRRKYDATGDETEKQPENTFSDAMNVVAAMLNAVLQDCANSGKSPLECDIISLIEGKIRQAVLETEKTARILRNMLDFDKQMSGKFSRKKTAERNFFEDLIQQRIRDLNMQIANTESGLKKLKDAAEEVKDYKYIYTKSNDSYRVANNMFSFYV